MFPEIRIKAFKGFSYTSNWLKSTRLVEPNDEIRLKKKLNLGRHVLYIGVAWLYSSYFLLILVIVKHSMNWERRKMKCNHGFVLWGVITANFFYQILSFVKNQRFPFLLIRTETKPAEENLRIKNKTQRNLFDAESHWSEPQLNQENNIWIIRTLLSFCVATSQKWSLARLPVFG